MNNSSEDVDASGRGLCDLTQSYSFILQSVLGVLAFSTLLCEYTRSALKRIMTPSFLFSSEALL